MADDPNIEMQDENGNPIVQMAPEQIVGNAPADEVQQEFGSSSIGRQSAIDQANYNPGQWNSSLDTGANGAEIQMPPDFAGRQPSSVSQGGGASFHQSSSTSGHPGGVKGVDDEFALADRQANEDFQKFAPGYAAEEASTNQHYDEQKSALMAETDARSRHANAEAKIYDRLDDFNHTYLQGIQKIQADAKVHREQVIGQYTEQLAGVRALAMVDANPLHGLSKGSQIGLGGAMFAQGFLAAQGIHIDVTGQVDRWVDRSIQEHQRSVENARGAAQDTMHLYEVARQSSEDDIEARMRYRGMVIEGTKVQLEAQAARFNSNIASARGAYAAAKLDEEKDGVIRAIGDKRMGAYAAFHKERLEAAKWRGDMKLKREANALGWANHASQAEHWAREDANKANEKKPEAPTKIQDPSNVKRDAKGNIVSGGKVIAQINWDQIPKELRTETAKRVTDAQQLYGELNTNLNHIKEVKKRLDATSGPDWYKKTSSPEYREYDAARKLTVFTIRKFNSGTASSDKEGQEYDDALSSDKWLQVGNNDKLIGNMDRWGRTKFEAALKIPGVSSYKGGDDEYADQMTINPAAQATDKINAIDPKTNKPIKSFTDNAYTAASDPTGKHSDTGEASGEPGMRMPGKVPASVPWARLMGTKMEPEHVAEAVTHLATAVLAPDKLRSSDKYKDHVIGDNGELISQARDSLTKIAGQRIGNNATMSAEYAQAWLDLIDKDPEGAAKLLDAAW